ncbi:WG repeat-containing protein [Thermonema sp.]|uniref:WG repeat-containing protein n=1 Tax=Thermonema sp. TaxID=2231181 RepID=UPI002590C4CD|nr:WG repeat-containing protein [Thermonema sp.]
MSRIFTLLLISSVFFFNIQTAGGQSVFKKGVRALAKGDYEQLEAVLQRAAKRHARHPLRFWLWARYRGIDSLPHHNYEEAHFLLDRAVQAWQEGSVREQSRWLKIARLASFDSLYRYRDYLDRRLLDQIKAGSDLQAVEHYLQEHAHSPYKVEAITWRDSLAFAQAQAADTYDAYEEFIARYPGAPQVEQARRRRDMLLFEEWTTEGKLQDYLDFLARFPDSYARDEAERRIFYLSTATFRPEDFLHFLENYPQSSMRRHALQLAACLAMFHDRWAPLAAYAHEPEVLYWKEYAPLRKQWLFPYFQDGWWGVAGPDGNILIPPHLERLWKEYGCAPITDDFIVVEDRHGRLGIYDRRGKKLFGALFEDLEWLGDGLAWVATAAGEGLVHVTGMWLIDAVYERLEPFVNHTFLARRGGVWGLLDVYGRVLLPFEYDKIELWREEALLVLHKAGSAELLPLQQLESLQQGEVYYPLAIFDEVAPLEAHHLKVRAGDAYGALDASLQVALDVTYKEVDLKKNTWIVHTGRGVCLLRMSGRPLVADTFHYARAGTHYIVARRDSLWHIYDYLGQALFRQPADTAYFLGSAVLVQAGKKTMLLLENRAWQDRSDYYDFQLLRTSHDAGRYFIQMRDRRDKIGVIDRYGQERLPFRYEAAYMLDNYLIKVHVKRRVGLVDTSGQVVLPIEYEGIGDLIEGTIPLMKRGRFGVFVPGQVLIEPQFEALLHPEGRYWRARLQGNWGLIDAEGKKLLPFRYERIEAVHDSLFLVKAGLQWQLVNPLSGQVFWEGSRVESFDCENSRLLLLYQGKQIRIWKDGAWMACAEDYVQPYCVQGKWVLRSEQATDAQETRWRIAWKDLDGQVFFETLMREEELFEWDCD